MLRYCESFSLLIFLKLNKEMAVLFSCVLRCPLLFECTKSFQTIRCRYSPAETNVKNFSHKDLRGCVRMGGPLFKICSLFLVMCQKVKRRLVVRSNDDRRHSTTIFSERVAVTEISKQIVQFYHFAIGRELNLF